MTDQLTILDQVKGTFTPAAVARATAHNGNDRRSTERVLAAALPVLLVGFCDSCTNGEGAYRLAKMAYVVRTGEEMKEEHLFSRREMPGLLPAGVLLYDAFGSKLNGIRNVVACYSGSTADKAYDMLCMVTAIILLVLGRQLDKGIDEQLIASLLGREKEYYVSAMPPELGFSGGIDGRTLRYQSKTAGKKTPGRLSGLLMGTVLVMMALLARLIMGFTGCSDDNSPADHRKNMRDDVYIPAAAGIDSITGDLLYYPGDTVLITLPGSTQQIIAGTNSTEHQLLLLLDKRDTATGRIPGKWLPLTNVHFKGSTNELTAASLEQLRNIALITKAYPALRLRIAAFTDSSGDEAFDQALSYARAAATAGGLIASGASPGAIGSVNGYGSKWPVGDNSTKEGRAMNRRVAVRVMDN